MDERRQNPAIALFAMPSSFEIVILGEDDYHEEYNKAFANGEYTSSLTKEMQEAEFDQFDDSLRNALLKYWKDDPRGKQHDFEVMDDWNGTWHHCGGIYSARICCPEYIETIIQVISALSHAELWTYHTACESLEARGIESGEFFIRNGKMYVPDDGNNYAAYFGAATSKTAHRTSPLSIHEAAARGDLTTVKKLVEVRPELTRLTNQIGQTALHEAVQMGHHRAVRYLLAKGAEVNARFFLGTPLHLAAGRNGSKRIAQLLLDKGAEVDAKDNQNETALHKAALHNQAAVARLLLAHGADANARDDSGRTPLFPAAWTNARRVAAILLKCGSQMNVKDHRGVTPLHWAAKNGSDATAALFLANGAEVNVADEDGITPLYGANSEDRNDLVRLLLEYEADVNMATIGGVTPLHIAALHGQAALVKILLAHRANVNARTRKGSTPLHDAAHHNHVDVGQVLIAHGANINARDENGKSPLQVALEAESHRFAALLSNGQTD